MKNLISFFLAIPIITFSISGCSKGSAGPAGPAGPAGSDSVLHSAWVALSMTQNVDTSNDTFYTQTINAASLTANVISTDVIVSYIGVPGSGPNGTTGNDTLVVNVSDVYTLSGGGYITQDLLPGIIELLANFDLSGDLYRYVIVPSSTLTTSTFKQYTKEQIRAMDFVTLSKLVNTANAKASSN
ncbi:MAG TPA: hypothetical protein VKR53_14540 [Puia sp.]|nr:hypothetical protein [Puia sp.]